MPESSPSVPPDATLSSSEVAAAHAAAAVDSGVGLKLGRYQVLRRIAAGGMAEIFLARVGEGPGPAAPDGLVVIKRILPALAVQPDFVAMFVDEAKLAESMRHPNIVRTFDIGAVDSSYFMAMEYLHGEDLRAIMKAQRDQALGPSHEHAVRIIAEVLAALHYAHDQIGSDGSPLQVVHRDVSPQNVIVTYDGTVKLLDFGIAKAQGRFGETKYGTLKGKIGYMSPEQCRGEPLDRRSDVFTAAILLFELATGRRLYHGHSEFDVLKRIVEGEVPSPRALDAAFPAELDRVIVRGLTKDPAERYQSAKEMADDLWAISRSGVLVNSAAALAEYMERLFAKKLAAWKQAQAEGKDLAQHLANDHGEIELEDEDLVHLHQKRPAPEKPADAIPQRIHDTPSARPRTASGAPRFPTPPPIPPHVSGKYPTFDAKVAAADAPVAVLPPATHKGRRAMPRSFAVATIAAGVLLVGSASGVVWVHRGLRPAAETSAAAAAALASDKESVATPTGSVEVTTTPAGATLYLDGHPFDQPAPATLPGVAANQPHILTAELAGYHGAIRHLAVAPGGVAQVSLVLEPRARRNPGQKQGPVRHPKHRRGRWR